MIQVRLVQAETGTARLEIAGYRNHVMVVQEAQRLENLIPDAKKWCEMLTCSLAQYNEKTEVIKKLIPVDIPPIIG